MSIMTYVRLQECVNESPKIGGEAHTAILSQYYHPEESRHHLC